MQGKRILHFVAATALAGTILLSGCSKKSNQPASNAAQQQPASQTPPPPPPDQTATPAASQPAAPASNQAPAPPANANQPAAQAQNQMPPPPPPTLVIPTGTRLRVRLDQDLGSKISQSGDSFTATVEDPVVVDGRTVIPRGASADGTVIDAKPLGRFKGGAMLAIRLDRVRTRWGSYPVATSTMERAEKGKGKRTAGFIGGGGAFGALIGGLAGGGKGALIGGLAGAGAGTAGTAMTGNKQIVLPAETLLTFRLEHSVHVTAQ